MTGTTIHSTLAGKFLPWKFNFPISTAEKEARVVYISQAILNYFIYKHSLRGDGAKSAGCPLLPQHKWSSRCNGGDYLHTVYTT